MYSSFFTRAPDTSRLYLATIINPVFPRDKHTIFHIRSELSDWSCKDQRMLNAHRHWNPTERLWAAENARNAFFEVSNRANSVSEMKSRRIDTAIEIRVKSLSSKAGSRFPNWNRAVRKSVCSFVRNTRGVSCLIVKPASLFLSLFCDSPDSVTCANLAVSGVTWRGNPAADVIPRGSTPSLDGCDPFNYNYYGAL